MTGALLIIPIYIMLINGKLIEFETSNKMQQYLLYIVMSSGHVMQANKILCMMWNMEAKKKIFKTIILE